MPDQRLDGYAIKDGSGSYIGLDQASGGYPYIPKGDALRAIHIWSKREDAERYREIMRRGSGIGGMNPASRWRVVRVVLIEIEDEKTT